MLSALSEVKDVPLRGPSLHHALPTTGKQTPRTGLRGSFPWAKPGGWHGRGSPHTQDASKQGLAGSCPLARSIRATSVLRPWAFLLGSAQPVGQLPVLATSRSPWGQGGRVSPSEHKPPSRPDCDQPLPTHVSWLPPKTRLRPGKAHETPARAFPRPTFALFYRKPKPLATNQQQERKGQKPLLVAPPAPQTGGQARSPRNVARRVGGGPPP